ncbi:GlxA family transcriptional regulator, partial [Escherichia coli]|nr:GlxA family transcriptional regulator [Escherichia coli]
MTAAASPASPLAPPVPTAPTVVAVIAYDGISPFHLSVPSVVFGKERDAAASPVF